jgi:hypothetical protein
MHTYLTLYIYPHPSHRYCPQYYRLLSNERLEEGGHRNGEFLICQLITREEIHIYHKIH